MTDLVNRSFGQLQVLELLGKNAQRRDVYRCKCNCGNVVIVGARELQSGSTSSCGCLHSQRLAARNKLRRLADTNAFTRASWRAMKNRCLDPADKDFFRYGAVGITVCDAWAASFQAFLADMGPRPKGTTLDRWPDLRGNYEPGNCRWATPQQQAENRKSTRWVVLAGEVLSTTEAAKRLSISPAAVVKRQKKWGSVYGRP